MAKKQDLEEKTEKIEEKTEENVKYKITSKCMFCLTCVELCPNGAIKKTYPIYSIDQELCDRCGLCYEVCRHHAIIKVKDNEEDNEKNNND